MDIQKVSSVFQKTPHTGLEKLVVQEDQFLFSNFEIEFLIY